MKPLQLLPAAFVLAACVSLPGRDRPPAVSPPEPYAGPWGSKTEAAPAAENASLWTDASTSLLSMRRAKDVGDLLTVIVEMNDRASLQSSLSRSRSSAADLNVDALLGVPDWAGGLLPAGASLSPAYDFERTADLNGAGSVNRADKITFTLAARVVGVEPNGNLIIRGYQETRVSNEIRYLTVSGVIRTQDITRTNTVSYEKIADAQLAYVSEGDTTGLAERGVVPKLLDRLLPF